MSARLATVALCVVALLGGTPSAGQAQDVGPEPSLEVAAEAQALFRRGLELSEEDRWAEALELFRRSLALVTRPSTLFNIGFALFRLGRFVQAIDAFDTYLARTTGEVSDLRDEAARRRGEAIASLAELELSLAPPDALLLVDGELSPTRGAPRVLQLDPGRHVLRASADGYDAQSLELSVLAAEHTRAALTLQPVAPSAEPSSAAPAVLAPTEPSPPPGPSLVEEPLFWVVVGALVVGAALGVGVGVGTSGGAYGGSTGVVLVP